MFKFIKVNKINTNINDSKLTFSNQNNLRNRAFLSIQNQFKNRTLRFRTLSYLPIFNMMLPIFERTSQSEIKLSHLS